jgi:hypothetical protein
VGSPLTAVVQGYAALGSRLVEQWTDQAAKVAARLDDGTYDADAAAADLAAAAKLAVESAMLFASEALDAVANLTVPAGVRYAVDSPAFTSPVPGAALSLTGPLITGGGIDALSAAAVTIAPAQLADGATGFRLRANAAGHCGGAYVGRVLAQAAQQVETMPVWLVVP